MILEAYQKGVQKLLIGPKNPKPIVDTKLVCDS
jgi:hypothetical protein